MSEEEKEEKNMEGKVSGKEKDEERGSGESEVENVETKEGIIEKEKIEEPKTKKNSNFLYIILLLGFIVVIVLTALPIFMGSNVDNPFAEIMTQYDTNPPTSGEHDEQFFPESLVYSEPLEPAFQVHILEPHELEQSHIPVQNSGEEGRDLVKSGVLLQYNCDCPDIVEKLTAISSAYRPRVIVAPWPYMEEKIAITAWRKIEKFDSIDEIAIRNFIEETFDTYDDYIECLSVRDKTYCATQAGYI